MKPFAKFVFLTLFSLLLMFSAGSVLSQSCTGITFSFEHYEPCKFRARYNNTTDCFTEIRYTLESGTFSSWIVNDAAGFTVDVISPSELWIHHSQGVLPLGNQVPLNFTLPTDLNTNILVAYLDDCAQEGCEILGGIPIESCPDPADASISGVKYRECGNLPYSNQPLIPDWTIQLLDAMGTVLGEQVTDADGAYAFYDMPAGQYFIREANLPDWTAHVPATGEYALDLGASEQVVRNFGNCPSCSCDSIYMDVVQLLVNSDTCNYSLSLSNTGAYCFNSFTLSLTSGTFADVNPTVGWTAVQVDSQHIQLDPPAAYLAFGWWEPCFFRVTGSDVQAITVTTSYNTGGMPVTCTRAFSYPCPPPSSPPPCCPAGNQFGSELTKNGDFELGNQDFTNGYTYFNPGGVTMIGKYSVLNQSQVFLANSQWASVDHTTYSATGKMLIVDGYGGPIAWQQPVNVVAGTTYSFSAWFNNLVIPTKDYDDPQMALFVDNNMVAGPLNLPENPDQWIRLCEKWTATTTGQVILSIRMLATTSIGNDVGIDDISFLECITPPTCTCNQQSIVHLNYNGQSHDINCALTFLPIFPCPTTPMTITSDFGCVDTSGVPCAPIDWVLTGPAGVLQGAVPAGVPFSETFPASNFSSSGLYTFSMTSLCPGQMDSCKCVVKWEQMPCDSCPPACLTTTLDISTGADPLAPGNYLAPGNSDPMWMLIAAPSNASLAVPQPAQLVGTYGNAWDAPPSTWLSAFPFNNYAANNCTVGIQDCNCPPFIYERRFCLCDSSQITFDFDFWTDNNGRVELWKETAPNSNIFVHFNTLVDNCPNLNAVTNFDAPPSGPTYTVAPFSVNTTLSLPKARYSLRIYNWNTSSVAMAANLHGTVQGLNLEKDTCCMNPVGTICVTKYRDINCDGVRDLNNNNWTYIDPGLANWNFNLNSGSTSLTGTTNGQGQVCFTGLTPGNYTLSEVLQPGWTPSNPIGGTTAVTVNPFTATNIEFGNCTDTCACGPFEFLYSVGHGPLLPKYCGDVLYIPDGLPFAFLPSFSCLGYCGPTFPAVDYILSGPPGFTPLIGTVSAIPGFSLPINAGTFTIAGTYTLMLTGYCGNHLCPCQITFVYPGDCCKDVEIFCQNLLNAVSITVDDDKCKATMNIGNLPECDSIAWVDWKDGPGSLIYGPFGSGAMPMYSYSGSGTYVIEYLAIETDPITGLICFEKVIRDTIDLNCDSCQCGMFDKIKLINKKLGTSQNLSCNNQTIGLNCPPIGKPYKITGKLVCNPSSCNGKNIHWELIEKNTNLVKGSGNQSGPWFSINITHSLLAGLNGFYDLVLTGTCGTDTCQCILHFDIAGCPGMVDCPCDQTFMNNVQAGFNYNFDWNNPCRWIFQPNKLTPCDVVKWEITKVGNATPDYSGNSTGNQAFNILLPLNSFGTYLVCMIVSRPTAQTQPCIDTFKQTVNINCIILGLCTNNSLNNPSFEDSSEVGVLGMDGASLGWNNRSGTPQIISDTGCEGQYALRLAGKCIGDIDIVDHPIFVENLPKGRFRFCYKAKSEELRPGTQLVLSLSTDPIGGLACDPIDCQEIGRVDIASTEEGWINAGGTFTLANGFEGDKYLSLHVENDLTYDEEDANSNVTVDGFCFEQTDTLFTSNQEPRIYGTSIRIFPNPNSGVFVVELSEPAKSGMTFRVMDLTGRLVQEQKVGPGSERYTIQAGALPQGFYILNVEGEGKVLAIEKFVKQ